MGVTFLLGKGGPNFGQWEKAKANPRAKPLGWSPYARKSQTSCNSRRVRHCPTNFSKSGSDIGSLRLEMRSESYSYWSTTTAHTVTSTSEAIASPTVKSERLYGKGELSPAEDALLRRVVSMVQKSESLKRELRGLSAMQEQLLEVRDHLRADLGDHLRNLQSARKLSQARRTARLDL